MNPLSRSRNSGCLASWGLWLRESCSSLIASSWIRQFRAMNSLSSLWTGWSHLPIGDLRSVESPARLVPAACVWVFARVHRTSPRWRVLRSGLCGWTGGWLYHAWRLARSRTFNCLYHSHAARGRSSINARELVIHDESRHHGISPCGMFPIAASIADSIPPFAISPLVRALDTWVDLPGYFRIRLCPGTDGRIPRHGKR